jgi:hypothetical protein
MEELKDISPRLFPAAIENSTYDDDQDIEDKEEEIEDKEEEIEDEEEEIPRQPRGGKSKRIPPMKQKRKKVPKPKTATTSKRRNGHVAGINRATGERTLVGTYPAIMVDGKFTCPHPNCQTEEHSWTTKNGYKYHLHHVCWRNPKSTKMLRMKAGLPFKASKGKPEFDCECGQSFRSKNGYMSHRHSNESTRDGRCLIKVQKRMAAQRGMAKEEDNGTREPEKMDWSSEVFDVDGRSNQEQLPDTALD